MSRFYGTLRKVERHGGHRKIADLWRFENENNPDAEEGNPLVDSNPVDVYADHGRFFVADAGGNSVLRVELVGRHLAGRDLRGTAMSNPFGRARPGTRFPCRRCPTGVVKGPDGALYVSQLTGFPFPVGGANVYRIDPRGGEPTLYAWASRTSSTSTSARTARSTCSRSTTTGCSARPASPPRAHCSRCRGAAR